MLSCCFALSYKQNDIKTNRPLSTAIFVQHLANYALDLLKKKTRLLLNCNSKIVIIKFHLASIKHCLTFQKGNAYFY